MKKITSLILGSLLIINTSCDQKEQRQSIKEDVSQDVEMITDYGTIIMRLSDETPKHRDNFIKLINAKFYDSIQFHRIIENSVVQTGSHKTKQSYKQMKTDTLPLPDLVPAEFRPHLFHKRGALNAARMGDDTNPSRSSAGSEFTIVQGNIQTDSMLDYSLGRLNKWTAKNNVINRPEYKQDFDELVRLSKEIDKLMAYDRELTPTEEEVKAAFLALKDTLDSINFDSLAHIELATMKKYRYPASHRDVYKNIGGAPHLDQNYTVFGEVIQGMSVVDSIAAVATDESDTPIKDVYIISSRMIERRLYN